MRVLLIHPSFPGQFRHLAEALRQQGHEVTAIGAHGEGARAKGVRYLTSGGDPTREQRHLPAEARPEAQFAQGRRVGRVLAGLRQEGWIPDLVLGHPFWGDLLCIDDVYPDIPLVPLLELDLQGVDLAGFDPEAHRAAGCDIRQSAFDTFQTQYATRRAIERMTWGLTATQFQRSTFPPHLRSRIAVLHEGVDLQVCQPDPLARVDLGPELTVGAGAPVITFASRNLEPLRGFLTLMRAIPHLQRLHQTVRVVIAGRTSGLGYGPPPSSSGTTWLQWSLEKLGGTLDLKRVHFMGTLPRNRLLRLFQISRAHVFLTYPYVLSWSLLESMACGALVLGSDTKPVKEVIEHGRNGLLVDFFDAEALAAQILAVLDDPRGFAGLRVAARRTIMERFDRTRCMEAQIRWLEGIVNGTTSAAAPAGPPIP